jgi:hypothetical protein
MARAKNTTGIKLPIVTTMAAQIKAMTNAAEPIKNPPPEVSLREEDLKFWPGLMRCRLREEWTESDLILAAQLCRIWSDMAKHEAALADEPHIGISPNGFQIPNARFKILSSLHNRQIVIMRSLKIIGVSVGLPKDTVQKMRGLQRVAEETRAQVQEDDLLAR